MPLLSPARSIGLLSVTRCTVQVQQEHEDKVYIAYQREQEGCDEASQAWSTQALTSAIPAHAQNGRCNAADNSLQQMGTAVPPADTRHNGGARAQVHFLTAGRDANVVPKRDSASRSGDANAERQPGRMVQAVRQRLMLRKTDSAARVDATPICAPEQRSAVRESGGQGEVTGGATNTFPAGQQPTVRTNAVGEQGADWDSMGQALRLSVQQAPSVGRSQEPAHAVVHQADSGSLVSATHLARQLRESGDVDAHAPEVLESSRGAPPDAGPIAVLMQAKRQPVSQPDAPSAARDGASGAVVDKMVEEGNEPRAASPAQRRYEVEYLRGLGHSCQSSDPATGAKPGASHNELHGVKTTANPKQISSLAQMAAAPQAVCGSHAQQQDTQLPVRVEHGGRVRRSAAQQLQERVRDLVDHTDGVFQRQPWETRIPVEQLRAEAKERAQPPPSLADAPLSLAQAALEQERARVLKRDDQAAGLRKAARALCSLRQDLIDRNAQAGV